MTRYLAFSSLVCLIAVFSCQKETSFEQGKLSHGSLQNSAGECMPKIVAGSYVAAQSLTDSNYIELTVDVTETGQYTIVTDTVNGYYFKGSGSFSTVGPATIRISGVGTPTSEGTDNFMVFYDSSFCAVTIDVMPAGSTPSLTDHLILYGNSWWSYATPFTGDTLKRTMVGSYDVGGVTYRGMKELNAQGNIDDTLFFRKSGNDYYNINYVDAYSSFFYDDILIDSLLILKEGLSTGDTWSSPEYTGTDNGTPKKLRYDFTCTDANATVSLNSVTYNNVYKVTMKAMVDEGSGYVPDITWINYYAQGIGWIYQNFDDGTNSYEIPIRYYSIF